MGAVNFKWAACIGAIAAHAIATTGLHASIIIKTNDGMGADAEVRESETNAQFDEETFTNTLKGSNRGNDDGIATRARNTDENAANDRSSIMFMKFDISSLPGSGDAFWSTHDEVKLRMHVRNNNISGSRVYAVKPGLPSTSPNDPNKTIYQNYERVKFTVRALEPTATFADDLGGTTTRFDANGNEFTSEHYKYNWDEGDGSDGSGITFYDAPGITPHCISPEAGCSTTASIGLYDDFNSDTRFIGNWMWPRVEPANHLAVGAPLDFKNAAIKQLVLDAKDAGRDTVTLMVHFGSDTQADDSTPSSFLNFNYSLTAKETIVMVNDSNYDSDTDNPDNPLGSPYSCSHANCPGGVLGDNSTGAFSPKLIISIPEPTSFLLFGLSTLLMASLNCRRRR